MIDIHSHIAWDIDDGFPNKEDAVEALLNAKRDGISTIVSTPHFVPGQLDQELFNLITKRQTELIEEAQNRSLTIYSGAEVFMNHCFTRLLDEGMYRTINNTKYLLVEFDVRKDIHHIDDFDENLYEITIRDMVPIIAHVERYFHKGIDKKIIQKWFDQGYIFQINRTSLLGYNGKQMQKNALWLLNHGMVHIVASDAHRLDGIRKEKLSDAKELIEKKFGNLNATLLFSENPRAILENRSVKDMEVKKDIFSWLKR